jgi:hypothetical protein
MPNYIWLDDSSECDPSNHWYIKRDVKECLELLINLRDAGFKVDIISLDHNLGWEQPTGYAVVDWIIKENYWPDIINVHSMNNIAAKWMIYDLMRCAPGHVRIQQWQYDSNVAEALLQLVR